MTPWQDTRERDDPDRERSRPAVSGTPGIAAVADLAPASFALVMATGIVSIASSLSGMRLAARALFWVNALGYALLWLLTLARLARFPRRVAGDLVDHVRGAGFFTLVAATAVLGSQLVILDSRLGLAIRLWGIAACLWLIVMYAFLTAVVIRTAKPPLAAGIDGSWLLAVVATQSIALLGALVAPDAGGWRAELLFVSLAMHLVGWVLYLLITALIFYRLAFFDLLPQAFGPAYWINMGAVAITTLAGATVTSRAGASATVSALGPFLRGLTLLAWATSTWWIPLLLILAVWRQLGRPLSLRYDPQSWAMVFPLGMYATCTFALARRPGLAFLHPLAQGFADVALVAWLITFAALAWRLASWLLLHPAPRVVAQTDMAHRAGRSD